MCLHVSHCHSQTTLLQTWKARIRRSATSAKKDDFKVTANTKVCSKHFLFADFIEYDSKRRKLKQGAVPSVFSWSNQSKRKSPKKRYDSEATDTASESEENPKQSFEEGVQVCIPIPCSHRFSMNIVLASNPKMKLVQFYTGFPNYEIFKEVLNLIVPGCDRSSIVYWDNRRSHTYVSGPEYFDSDEDDILDMSDDEGDDAVPPSRTHKLSVEEEFLLTMMKLRLGLFNKDLAVRFGISLSTVSKIFMTWINLIYIKLGSLNIFPHRDIIMKNMTKEFKQQYPNVMLIIDCTELRIQMPSSLVRKSQTYSDYKSTNTFKGLVGVDSKGGIMFVSHLYTGSISDKEICQRSGFYALLKRKIENGELQRGDGIMADKGFNIHKELEEHGLKLNIPPFLGKRKRLSADDVLQTRLIAHHRIQVERAIGKVKNFHIFDTRFRLRSAGILNQIWTDCCLLANFQDPLIVRASDES